MQSKAKTVEEYLESLPEERKAALSAVRKVILDNLAEGYVETMQYGMISYVIPLERYPVTYNKQPLTIVSLASQKNFCAIYMMNTYGNPELKKWFIAEAKAAGYKLDAGKSCLRFKKPEDLPLSVIGKSIARTSVEAYISSYEKARKS